MNEQPKGKVRRAAAAVAGSVASDLVGNVLTPGSPGAPPPPPPQPETAAAETPHEAHAYVPEVETSTVTHGEDGSVAARTGTVWHPETTEGTPVQDLPTVEEFEQIDVHEDADGNFVIDATERFVVRDHGHDEVYVDHQHVVVPGDGTPGDADLTVVQNADAEVHENPDGTISVDHHGSVSYERTPDAPGHGDVEVFQDESVVVDDDGGPPGREVAVKEDEQAKAEDPFGEPAGPVVHQTETVGDKPRGTAATTSVTAPAPALPGPPVVAVGRMSTVDPQPAAAETAALAASSSLADHPTAPHSFATEPAPKHHDAGEVTGTRAHPAGERPFEPPRHHEPAPVPDAPPPVVHEAPPDPPVDPPGLPQHEDQHDHHDDLGEPEPAPGEHPAVDHHAHADGGG